MCEVCVKFGFAVLCYHSAPLLLGCAVGLCFVFQPYMCVCVRFIKPEDSFADANDHSGGSVFRHGLEMLTECLHSDH